MGNYGDYLALLLVKQNHSSRIDDEVHAENNLMKKSYSLAVLSRRKNDPLGKWPNSGYN